MTGRPGVNVTALGPGTPEVRSDGGERRSSFSAQTLQRQAGATPPDARYPRGVALAPAPQSGTEGEPAKGLLDHSTSMGAVAHAA